MKNQKHSQRGKFVYVLIIIGFIVLAACQEKTGYYVATDGNDDNPGTKEQPFKTIERGRDAVRQLLISDRYPAEGVTVFLRGGQYVLDQPIRFLPVDSGHEGAPVVYAAVEGEKPYISGGDVIKGWEQDTRAGIWKAPAKRLFRQLYVNDRRAVRARFSDNGETFYKIISWRLSISNCLRSDGDATCLTF